MKYTSRYPGIKPFDTEEEHIFFGRDADVKSLYALVAVEKTVLLYSKSGLGKSSLINAGLIPKLKSVNNINYAPVTIRLGSFSRENNMTPAEKVIDHLKKAISFNPLNELFSDLNDQTLSYWLKSIQLKDPKRTIVLIFDQFEELFSYPEKQIDELALGLHELLYQKISDDLREKILSLSETRLEPMLEDQLNTLTSSLNIRILFVVRSDKLSLLNRLAKFLPNLQHTFYLLEPLKWDEARNAIIKPAVAEGDFPSPRFEFADETVDKIIDNLSDKRSKPIETFQLQLVCQYVENLMLRNRQKRIVYAEDLGDIREIHQRFYDNLMSEIETENENERILLRDLIEKEFIYEPEQRRKQVLEGIILDFISRKTLLNLEKTHIIRSEPYQDSFTYELSHDTLVEPILKSFHKRNEEKERQDIEKKRAEERRKNQEKIRRQRRLIFMFSGLTFLCIGFLIFAIIKMNEAKTALDDKNKLNEQIKREKNAADTANIHFLEADKTRKELEVNTLINDAIQLKAVGFPREAKSFIDRALKIDSANKTAKKLLLEMGNK